ncbi:Tc5 transposase DNA-binding domain [Popillia japonica]|uniref:Tc5 transposase DNA-binding domain n=1 Tax=Popillia japonica TaxID=7064 RepID=A0AAW1HVK1_POPJA
MDEHVEKKAYVRFRYTEEQLQHALESIRRNEATLSAANRQYGIPKGTLFNKLTGKVPSTRKMRPPTILTMDEEQTLEKWILAKAKLGFPMHPDEVKDTVQRVLKAVNRATPFTDFRPGNKWLKLFIRRHPTITKRNTEIISKARAAILEDENCADILDEPSRIFNADETGLQTCPKSGKLLDPKNYRNFYEIASGPEKECVTVLCTFSAIGESVPPMIVFPYKRIPRDIAASVPEDWGIGRSDSGWKTYSKGHRSISSRRLGNWAVGQWVDANPPNDAISISEYKTALKVIEHHSDPDLIKYFKAKRNNLLNSNNLFELWKVCADAVEGECIFELNETISESADNAMVVATENNQINNSTEMIDINTNDMVLFDNLPIEIDGTIYQPSFIETNLEEVCDVEYMSVPSMSLSYNESNCNTSDKVTNENTKENNDGSENYTEGDETNTNSNNNNNNNENKDNNENNRKNKKALEIKTIWMGHLHWPDIPKTNKKKHTKPMPFAIKLIRTAIIITIIMRTRIIMKIIERIKKPLK